MVLLYVPFRNERVEILDRNKFIQIFEQQQNLIIARCKAYNSNTKLKQLLEELRVAYNQEDIKIKEVAGITRFPQSANDDNIEHVNPF
jgi:hypothetical protein